MREQSGLPSDVDVVVVGAGMAGLQAAVSLHQEGHDVLVLEARSRVGGRVENARIGAGQWVELGGQWSAPRNHTLRALADRYGLAFYPTYTEGTQLLEVSRGIRRQRGTVPPLRWRALADVGLARLRLDRQARSLPLLTPWLGKHAEQWDRTSLGQWLDRRVHTREGREVLEVAATTIWGADPHRLNLLQALSYIRGAGDFDALTGTVSGELAERMVGGVSRLAEALAGELGERVVLGRAVTGITSAPDGVEVRCGEDGTVRARRVIVAVPPRLAGEISYTPELPEHRRRALAALPMADLIKVALVYDRPFWRDQGLSGQALTVRGPVTATFDNSPYGGSPGVLIGFVPGDRARHLGQLPEAERRTRVLETFSRLFGPRAGRPEQYLEKNWSLDPWSQGCYFGIATPGSLTGPLLALREPVGRIHWAGAETAYDNYGGIDGALASGVRAAREVTGALAARSRQAV